MKCPDKGIRRWLTPGTFALIMVIITITITIIIIIIIIIIITSTVFCRKQTPQKTKWKGEGRNDRNRS